MGCEECGTCGVWECGSLRNGDMWSVRNVGHVECEECGV